MTVDEAVRAVLNESNQPYAQTYANAMPEAVSLYGEEGKKAQVRYILSNLSHWRGERAREVKGVLKEYVK